MLDFPVAPHSKAEAELRAAERRLQDAIVAADHGALDVLLDDGARFLGPDGITVGKRSELDERRSGERGVTELTELAHETEIVDGVGITRVVVRETLAVHGVGGSAGRSPDVAESSETTGTPVTMAYTRVWQHGQAGWRVIAAQGARVS